MKTEDLKSAKVPANGGPPGFDQADREVWIIGAGKFGLKALLKLQKKMAVRFVVIDSDSQAVHKAQDTADKVVIQDGVDFLVENLNQKNGPDWIVPAVPVHLAYEWVCRKLKGQKTATPISIPDDFTDRLPNPIQGSNGEIYLSNADFICPDDCPEPDCLCAHTGKARPRILFQALEEWSFPMFRSIVVRSQQLAPGVGGYRPKELFAALNAILAADGPKILSTACKCHGVANGFHIESNLNSPDNVNWDRI